MFDACTNKSSHSTFSHLPQTNTKNCTDHVPLCKNFRWILVPLYRLFFEITLLFTLDFLALFAFTPVRTMLQRET